jgi:hypothetical protein
VQNQEKTRDFFGRISQKESSCPPYTLPERHIPPRSLKAPFALAEAKQLFSTHLKSRDR